ncbi:hypothetical protein [Candidatus Laterigemmans baculatus]|uniref:hypothetical protein n=1 Tax=Candidatus Laterigemmans baculatus TaxID=2770505 RepID=UPI0013DC0279|nr:hypothetical protein [Candidatus Laterigemmans baculatus]
MHPLKTERLAHESRFRAVGALVAACLLWGAAASVPAKAQDATRDQDSLGDGLGGLLEGLDLQTPAEPPAGPRPPQPATPEPATPAPTTPSPSPPEPAAGEDPASAAAPLLEAYRSMQAANALLARGETGQATRTAQRRAVELLDQMIEAAEQQSQSSGSGAPPETSPQQTPQSPQQVPGEAGQGSNAEQAAGGESGEESEGDEAGEPGSAAGGPGQPSGPQAVAAAGAGVRPELGSPRAESAVWGHLPERTRGMLRSEMPTEYLPAYATEISEYFRRLAEMQPDE